MTHNGQYPTPMGLFGSGRSGTTWLGAIISSHPGVAYRFEPLHRLAPTLPNIRELRAKLSDDAFGPEITDELYESLIPARPLTAKPPFFPKRRMLAGRSVLWPFARSSTIWAHAYERLYTPRDRRPLVFKEVTSEPIMCNLLARTDMRIVYLIRHPVAVAHSVLAGQGRGLMPAERKRVIADTLESIEPGFADRLHLDYERLTPIEIAALCWRADTETGFRAALASPNAHIVVYEDLCDDPLGIASRVFAHLGLELGDATREFIAASERGSAYPARLAYGEIGMNDYFSVFRDSRVTRDRWRDEVDPKDQARVMRLVENSTAFQHAFSGSAGRASRRARGQLASRWIA